MSTSIDPLKHPSNGSSVPVYKGFSWPCLFCGPLWFAVKGMWLWAIGSGFLAVFTGGFSWLIFPFFANGLHKKHLLSSGYLNASQINAQQTQVQYVPVVTTPVQMSASSGSTMVQPLAGVNVPSNGLPSFVTPQVNGLPSFTIHQREGSFKSNSFLFVRTNTGFTRKEKYLIVDLETPGVLFVINAQVNMGNKFDSTVETTDGKPFLRITGGGITSPLTTSIADASGAMIGTIKRKGLTELQEFRGFDASGNEAFDTKKAPVKAWTFEGDAPLFLQVIAGGQPVAEIKSQELAIIKKQMGVKWEDLVTKDWMDGLASDHPYRLDITANVNDLSKTLLLVTLFSARWIRNEGK